MTLSGVTRRRSARVGGILSAGSLRIGTFEGSRPYLAGQLLIGYSIANVIGRTAMLLRRPLSCVQFFGKTGWSMPNTLSVDRLKCSAISAATRIGLRSAITGCWRLTASVTFRWKAYAHGSKQRKMTLSATEFLRRFTQHILPRDFVRIRQ